MSQSPNSNGVAGIWGTPTRNPASSNSDLKVERGSVSPVRVELQGRAQELQLGGQSPAHVNTGMMSPAHHHTVMCMSPAAPRALFMSPGHRHAVPMSPISSGLVSTVQLPTPAITNLKASAPPFEEEKFPTVVKVYVGQDTVRASVTFPK